MTCLYVTGRGAGGMFTISVPHLRKAHRNKILRPADLHRLLAWRRCPATTRAVHLRTRW